MPILLEQIEEVGKWRSFLTMPYQPYITGVWYNKDLMGRRLVLQMQDIPETWQKVAQSVQKA